MMLYCHRGIVVEDEDEVERSSEQNLLCLLDFAWPVSSVEARTRLRCCRSPSRAIASNISFAISNTPKPTHLRASSSSEQRSSGVNHLLPPFCARMASRASSRSSSPLSNIDFDPYEAEYYQRHISDAGGPRAKRQRLDNGSAPAARAHTPDLDAFSISSDTSGDVPQSPSAARADDEDMQEQVTVCAWDGCQGGDFQNMDRLVAHIHNDHVEGKGKMYTCEWVNCPRKSYAHASAYALRAHMRSHTREKPFYCALPGM